MSRIGLEELRYRTRAGIDSQRKNAEEEAATKAKEEAWVAKRANKLAPLEESVSNYNQIIAEQRWRAVEINALYGDSESSAWDVFEKILGGRSVRLTEEGLILHGLRTDRDSKNKRIIYDAYFEGSDEPDEAYGAGYRMPRNVSPRRNTDRTPDDSKPTRVDNDISYYMHRDLLFTRVIRKGIANLTDSASEHLDVMNRGLEVWGDVIDAARNPDLNNRIAKDLKDQPLLPHERVFPEQLAPGDITSADPFIGGRAARGVLWRPDEFDFRFSPVIQPPVEQ